MRAACAVAAAGLRDAAAAAAAVYWPAAAWDTGRKPPAVTAGLFTAAAAIPAC